MISIGHVHFLIPKTSKTRENRHLDAASQAPQQMLPQKIRRLNWSIFSQLEQLMAYKNPTKSHEFCDIICGVIT